ncbi:MAG TPA: amidohydrolase family protein [Pyrinomonadaceae bacterium]|nr:amidohydrolase family protein [Pyrinomonadaceae bacterium]
MTKQTLNHFLRLVCLSLIALQVATAQSSVNKSDAQPLPIVDVHTHQKLPENAGVIGAVRHIDLDAQDSADVKEQNVVYCAGLRDRIDLKRLAAGLKSKRYGCIKIYLGYVYRYAYDKEYEPVYALAREYDVPVVFHTGDTYDKKGKLKYADPLTIDEVAVDHPDVRFVIAHCGNPWIESAAEVAYKNDNVYLECSALLLGNLDELPNEQVETYVVRPISWIFGYVENPTKLMFGTDFPLTDVKSYVNAYKRAVPKEHWKAVFHDNAVRVFKIPAIKVAP